MATTKTERKGKAKAENQVANCHSQQYPQVVLGLIDIAPRPEPGQEHEQLFYNPRNASRFTPEALSGIMRSIRTDGLLQPPICRSISGSEKVQLLAGERRIASLRLLIERNLPCYHERLERPDVYVADSTVLHRGMFAKVLKHTGEDVEIQFFDEAEKLTDERETVKVRMIRPTAPAVQIYTTIPVKLLLDCSDEEALRIAMSENEHDEPLTVAEEIAVVERLNRRGLNQREMAYCLGSNVTWVSQTLSFRSDLPPEAFSMLLDGNMARHVAISFFSYRPEDRAALFESTIKAEQADTAEKIRQHQVKMEDHQDAEELHLAAAEEADESGDAKTAKSERKKAESEAKKASASKKRRDRAKKDAGVIKQTHVVQGAAQAGIEPRKAKVLPRADIEQLYIDNLDSMICNRALDPVTGERLPVDLLSIVQGTAKAILRGVRDPIKIVRDYMTSVGKWKLPENAADDEECDNDDEESYDDIEEIVESPDDGEEDWE